MAKIDIKDAYYSVSIKKGDQKLLKFVFNGKLYKFTVLPNGYTGGPRKFTKLMKPPLATLRIDGATLAAYIDDIFNAEKSYQACRWSVKKFVDMLQSLGFVIHPTKSCFDPANIIEFLGFIINSILMTVSVTTEKKKKLVKLCKDVLDRHKVAIRKVASLLGKFTSCFIAVPCGKLHYRALERDKTEALARVGGDYDKKFYISSRAREEIEWWMHNIMDAAAPIVRPNPTITIKTDACLIGWGACLEDSRTGGFFSEEEQESKNINVLEARAVGFGLKALCKEVYGTHIKVLVYNTAAVGAINPQN